MMEILIVISIILILAVIGFTATSRMREAANNSRCVTNLRQLGVIAQLYASDNDGYILPPMYSPPTPRRSLPEFKTPPNRHGIHQKCGC